jgi:hypothetical protein
MNSSFIAEPLEPTGEFVDSGALSEGAPPLPRRFRRQNADIVVREIVRTWRSTKRDRGDEYLARHWFEIRAEDGTTAIVYFDRKARRGAPRWWLFSIAAQQE